MTRRGDVVIVEFPYVTGGAGKNRPAVVILCLLDDFASAGFLQASS